MTAIPYSFSQPQQPTPPLDTSIPQSPPPAFLTEKWRQGAGSSTCSLHSETLGTAWLSIDERGGVVHHAGNIDDVEANGLKRLDPGVPGGSLPSPWLRRLVRDRERMRWVSGVAGVLVLLLFICCIVFWVTSGLVPASTKYSTTHAQGPPKQSALPPEEA